MYTFTRYIKTVNMILFQASNKALIHLNIQLIMFIVSTRIKCIFLRIPIHLILQKKNECERSVLQTRRE